MKLNELEVGKTAKVIKVGSSGAIRQHFLDMGIIPGTELTLEKFAPMGDPMELRIHGYELTLRVADASEIEISMPYDKPLEVNNVCLNKEVHPGFGEYGKEHNHLDEHPLDKDVKLTFALVGNQNCGKTTLFNQITGMNQHVGNFPGVTVDQKSGGIIGHENTLVTDLPGILL